MALNATATAALARIGHDLDRGIFPLVRNGGIVMPSDAAVPLSLGRESNDDSWKGTRIGSRQEVSRQGPPAGGPWSPGQTPSIVSGEAVSLYEAELDAIRQAYPGTTVWRQDGCIWLLTDSLLLEKLQRAASFLIAISYTRAIVRAWGFWSDLLSYPRWIGPRHTNFPDGSVCAFEPADRSWEFGESLIELLDIYSVWAVRHLHLELFGRWPGPQSVAHPYERSIELAPDELCGCGQGSKEYRACCMKRDLARNRVADAVNFMMRYCGGQRSPPAAVVRAVHLWSEPPVFDELLAAS